MMGTFRAGFLDIYHSNPSLVGEPLTDAETQPYEDWHWQPTTNGTLIWFQTRGGWRMGFMSRLGDHWDWDGSQLVPVRVMPTVYVNSRLTNPAGYTRYIRADGYDGEMLVVGSEHATYGIEVNGMGRGTSVALDGYRPHLADSLIYGGDINVNIAGISGSDGAYLQNCKLRDGVFSIWGNTRDAKRWYVTGCDIRHAALNGGLIGGEGGHMQYCHLAECAWDDHETGGGQLDLGDGDQNEWDHIIIDTPGSAHATGFETNGSRQNLHDNTVSGQTGAGILLQEGWGHTVNGNGLKGNHPDFAANPGVSWSGNQGGLGMQARKLGMRAGFVWPEAFAESRGLACCERHHMDYGQILDYIAQYKAKRSIAT